MMFETYDIFLILMATCVGLCRPHCQPEFKPNFLNVIRLSYPIYQGNINKIWLTLDDNKPLIELLTPECRNVNNLRVDYRIVGEQEWQSFTGRRGVIALHKTTVKIQQIDPCAKYQIKIAAIKEYGGGEVQSEQLEFGPYYKQLSSEEIKVLGPDSMPDISSSISYSNVNSSGFTVSWEKICAQSLNIYLLTGPDFHYGNIINTLTDIIRNNVSSSLWVPAKPCKEYKIAMESFMTAQPLSMENSVDHQAWGTVSTTPGIQDFVRADLEERANFKIFSWTFMDHSACLSDERFEIYLVSQFGDEKQILKSGDWNEEHGEIDLFNSSSAACSDIGLLMKVNYKTKSGIWENGLVFNQTIRTNQDGDFAEEGSNHVNFGQEIVTVSFDSCDKEAVLLLADALNNTVVAAHEVLASAPQISSDVFAEHTKPCQKYNIQLVSSEEFVFNTSIHIFDQREFPTKNPLENVTISLVNTTTNSFTFEIEDTEENEKCLVENYNVECKEQAEKTKESDETNVSGEKAWEETVMVKSNISNIVTLTNLPSHTEFLCLGHITYKSTSSSSDKSSISSHAIHIVAKTKAASRVGSVAAKVAKTEFMSLMGGIIALVITVLLILAVIAIVLKCKNTRRDSLHVAEQQDYKPV